LIRRHFVYHDRDLLRRDAERGDNRVRNGTSEFTLGRYGTLNDVDMNDGHFLSAFDAHRDAHTTADAKGRQALLGRTFLHFVDEGNQYARA